MIHKQYADGFAYSKHKMEEAFRHLDKPPAKSLVGGKSDSSLVKKEDVDLIVRCCVFFFFFPFSFLPPSPPPSFRLFIL